MVIAQRKGEKEEGEINTQTWQTMSVKYVYDPESFFPWLLLKHILMSCYYKKQCFRNVLSPTVYANILNTFVVVTVQTVTNTVETAVLISEISENRAVEKLINN